MLASTVPWAPIVAFMVSSPLTSPTSLLLSAGLFGWPFAATFYLASLLLGLLGGALAELLERRGLLADQARFVILMPEPVAATVPATAERCCSPKPAALPMAFAAPPPAPAPVALSLLAPRYSLPVERWKLAEVGKAAWNAGRKLLVAFLLFATLGYLLANLIPNDWVIALFGGNQAHGVVLTALLGIPLYVNTEASLPLARGFMDAGMSQGAVLAFLITGAGTSIGAITGGLTIARWRVIGLVVATLFVGAVILGTAYNLLAL